MRNDLRTEYKLLVKEKNTSYFCYLNLKQQNLSIKKEVLDINIFRSSMHSKVLHNHPFKLCMTLMLLLKQIIRRKKQ